MFHSQQLNTKINKLHERALKIVYKNPNLTFKQLLDLDKSHCTHHRNLQKLAVEMFKIKKGLVPTPIKELFPTYYNVYNLRKQQCWKSSNVRTVKFGTETLLYRTKDMATSSRFNTKFRNTGRIKSKIKKWTPVGCTCRLCNIYIHNLGFI